MKELPEELLALIRKGEDYETEYKESKTKLPKSLYDTVSSFSNREGGDIFLGVHDCGVIMGVDDPTSQIASFVTTINNPDKINPALFLTPVAYTYTSDGTFVGRTKDGKEIQEQTGTYNIIHIHVPIAPAVIRNAGRIYDRNGDADVDITNLEPCRRRRRRHKRARKVPFAAALLPSTAIFHTSLHEAAASQNGP